MGKKSIFQSVWFRLGWKVLVWEVVLVALAWLVNKNFAPLQHLFFSDVLFLFAVLELMAASMAMLRSPMGMMGASGPAGVHAFPVQPNEDEKRFQIITEMAERNSFSLYLGISGVLTILLAIIVM